MCFQGSNRPAPRSRPLPPALLPSRGVVCCRPRFLGSHMSQGHEQQPPVSGCCPGPRSTRANDCGSCGSVVKDLRCVSCFARQRSPKYPFVKLCGYPGTLVMTLVNKMHSTHALRARECRKLRLFSLHLQLPIHSWYPKSIAIDLHTDRYTDSATDVSIYSATDGSTHRRIYT